MRPDLRRFVRRMIRQSGFQRTIAPTFVDVMRCHGVDVVLDIGANDGAFARDIRDAGYTGKIVSFEPASATYRRLVTAAARDPEWYAEQLGVGEADGHLDLSVCAIDVYNSFKRPSAAGVGATGSREVASERVKVVCLDSYLRERPDLLSKTYLKTDTQGFAFEVLRGASEHLERFVAVQVELEFVRLYESAGPSRGVGRHPRGAERQRRGQDTVQMIDSTIVRATNTRRA